MERVFVGGAESGRLVGVAVDSACLNREIGIFAAQALRWLGVAKEIRAAFRLARTGLHLLWGAATVAFAFPFLPLRICRALKARWSRQLLDALGVRLLATGHPPKCGLVVGNHISWLDIYVVNAMAPTAFVSKEDVRGWPLIGWLSSRTETIFLERGSRSSAVRTKDRVAGELKQGGCVAIFPEGTTSDGTDVLPFHSALFESAVEAGAPVAPIALRYTGRHGERTQAPVYIGATSLWQSLRAIAAADGLTAHLSFLPRIDSSGMNRRQIAEAARRNIAGQVVRPGIDTAGSGDAGSGGPAGSPGACGIPLQLRQANQPLQGEA